MSKSCEVCCGDLKEKTEVECPYCSYLSCIKCQKTYSKPCCMRCRTTFSRRFVLKTLGSQFIRQNYRTYIHAERLASERRILPLVQPFVEWEKERRRITSARRFADMTPIPPPPDIPEVHHDSFACPQSECRGFVFDDECGVCKKKVCPTCREFMKDDHVCNDDHVKTINALKNECRPCPTCRTPIFKTFGCDHMRCTYCGQHFDWVTLRTLASSTNHHYDRNLLTRPSTSNDYCNDDTNETLTDDGIPRDVFEEHFLREMRARRVRSQERRTELERVSKLLYEDRATVLFLKKTKFEEETLQTKANQDVHDLRVKFLLGEIDEIKWEQRIVATHETKEMKLAFATIMNLLLSELKGLQRLVYHQINSKNPNEIIDGPLSRLYTAIDEQLQSVEEEFKIKNSNKRTIRVRDDPLDANTPPIIL